MPRACRAVRLARTFPEAHLVETNWSMAGPMPGDPDWSGGTVFRMCAKPQSTLGRGRPFVPCVGLGEETGGMQIPSGNFAAGLIV